MLGYTASERTRGFEPYPNTSSVRTGQSKYVCGSEKGTKGQGPAGRIRYDTERSDVYAVQTPSSAGAARATAGEAGPDANVRQNNQLEMVSSAAWDKCERTEGHAQAETKDRGKAVQNQSGATPRTDREDISSRGDNAPQPGSDSVLLNA